MCIFHLLQPDLHIGHCEYVPPQLEPLLDINLAGWGSLVDGALQQPEGGQDAWQQGAIGVGAVPG